MPVLTCDEKGRLYLHEELRERYGKRFLAVPTPKEILLVPIPRDAVADLREATKKLRGKSLEELKQGIERAARHQVKHAVRRH
mgnify:CR=1 FL=1